MTRLDLFSSSLQRKSRVPSPFLAELARFPIDHDDHPCPFIFSSSGQMWVSRIQPLTQPTSVCESFPFVVTLMTFSASDRDKNRKI